MKFGRLAICNFLTIGEAGINLSDRGLLGVQGENEDDTSSTSNGAGKSTLGDALSWAIYGVTARGASGDSVVNNVAGKDCHVTANVFDGDDNYVISRYRKHTTHKNSLRVWQIEPTGTHRDLTQGTEKLTQAVIDKIIGCSYEVFTAAIYAGQEKMPDLPSLTDKNLKVLVEEAAGTTVLDAAYEEAKRRFNLASAQQAAAENLVDKAVNEQLAAEELIKEIKVSLEGWDKEQARVIDEKRSVLAAEIVKHGAIKTEVATYDKAAYEAELAACNTKLAAVEVERKVEQKLQREVGLAEASVKMERNEALRLKRMAEEKQHAIKHIDMKVGDACSECDRVYGTADIAPARKNAVDALRDLIAAFNAKKLDLEAAQKALESAQSTLEAHRRSMTDVSATSARVSALNDLIAKVSRLEGQLGHIKFTANGINDEIKAIKARINPFIERNIKAAQRFEAAEKALFAARKQRDVATEEMALADTVAKVFSPAGVRAHILDTVTPFLNDRTAHYLGTLSDGNIAAAWSTLTRTAKGELREKFKIDVQNTKGGKEFTLISGGEKRKVRLACALALQDLVAQRASKPIDLFIGDEIDDALDDAGLERLMAVLEEKARERGTVIIISHRSLRDWIRECVTVTKRGGQSVVSEAV